MELLAFPIRAKDYRSPIYIHVFSDIHRAAAGCDSKKLRDDIRRFQADVAKGEQHYWLGGGDWSNAVGVKDKRFDSSTLAPEFQEFVGDDLFGVEARKLAEEFKPIRDYGIGIHIGNHEDKIARIGEYNPGIDIAERLDLPYLGWSSLIRFNVRYDNTGHAGVLCFYWNHGRGAARSSGAKLNMLESMSKVVEADVYGVGHTHQIVDAPKVRLSVTRKGTPQLLSSPVLYFNSGTYLKTYANVRAQKAGQFNKGHHPKPEYGEKAGYEPTHIGHGGFRFYVHHGATWDTVIEQMRF